MNNYIPCFIASQLAPNTTHPCMCHFAMNTYSRSSPLLSQTNFIIALSIEISSHQKALVVNSSLQSFVIELPHYAYESWLPL